jgi:hypothetical protein
MADQNSTSPELGRWPDLENVIDELVVRVERELWRERGIPHAHVRPKVEAALRDLAAIIRREIASAPREEGGLTNV